MAAAVSTRLSPRELAARHRKGEIAIVDVREPMEYVGGHIAGSSNIPFSQLGQIPLPAGPLALVCQSGGRSSRAMDQLLKAGHPSPLADLSGGLNAWQEAGLPLKQSGRAPLPLMRQVQIAAGSLVLLGVILSQVLAPGWIWLSGFVGAGLLFAGLSGSCAMASLLAAMPWNRVES